MNRLFPTLVLLLLAACWTQTQSGQSGSQAPDRNQDAPATANQTGGKDTETSTSAPQEPAPNAANAAQPHTEIVPESASVPDPILDPGPLPNKPMSLLGGIVRKIDSIRNRVLIQPFGGGQEESVFFDDRTHIYRNGAATTLLGIHRGDRIYVDSMTLDNRVFARTIRVETATGPVEAHGQVVHFDLRDKVVQMHDSLTSQMVSFTITDRTALYKKDGEATIGDFIPGTLIEAVFAPGRKGGLADNVTILAVPGNSYIFLGRVTFVDASRGLLAVDNTSDQRSYELHYTPALIPEHNDLRVGAKIKATTRFDATGYRADSISILEPAPDSTSAQR